MGCSMGKVDDELWVQGWVVVVVVLPVEGKGERGVHWWVWSPLVTSSWEWRMRVERSGQLLLGSSPRGTFPP